MFKKSLLALSFIAASAAAHADGPPKQQFGEFQIEVTKNGKVLYTASTVLGPTANSVTEDGIRVLPMEAKCQPNYTINPPLTYKEGVKIELNANIQQNVAYGFFGFMVESPAAPQAEAPFGQGCKARLVIGHHYGSSGGRVLKVGEPSITSSTSSNNEVTVKLTLKKVFDTAPAGVEVGKLIRG